MHRDDILIKLSDIMRDKTVNAILVTDRYNMRYLAGYRGEGVILYTESDRFVLTDSRYTEQVQRECEGYECVDIASLGYA